MRPRSGVLPTRSRARNSACSEIPCQAATPLRNAFWFSWTLATDRIAGGELVEDFLAQSLEAHEHLVRKTPELDTVLG